MNERITKRYLPVYSTSAGLVVEFDKEPNGNIDGTETFRKYGTYVVAEIFNKIDNNKIYDNSEGKMLRFRKGPISYCYYFKLISKK